VARGFLSGGKRFRALFCYWGWQAVAGAGALEEDPFADNDVTTDLPGIVLAAAALEVFHAAALIHDDIMDRSDTRRGAPSAHRLFEAERVGSRANGDPAAFGTSAALLLGDLLLGWSDELFDRGIGRLSRPAFATQARVPRHSGGEFLGSTPRVGVAVSCAPRDRLQVREIQR
jgi:geranylgeranyl diphosphate synthase type I